MKVLLGTGGSPDGLDALSETVERAREDPDLDPSEAGHYRPVDMEFYESVGEEVRGILREVADRLRAVSIDEAYLDVTGSTDWDHVEGVARHLRARIETEVGVTASVGVAPTMSAAKIASDYDKPDGLVVVEPGDVREFLAPLDVAEIHNVGPVTARRLRDMGVETAGDLAAADPERVRDEFGERGLAVRRYARGEDPREVTPVGEPKSLSRESAFTEATEDTERKREKVRALAADVADRAQREGALYRTIGIKVVTPPYDVNTRAESLPGPVDDPDLLESTALALLEEFADDRVRKLGVRVSKLDFAESDQASLAGFEGQSSGAAGDATTDGESAVASADDGSDGSDGRDASDSPDGQRSLREYE